MVMLAMALALLIIYFFVTSWDIVKLIRYSEYPGQRFIVGGSAQVKDLFRYIYMFIVPFNIDPSKSPLEIATFISVSPIGIILALWLGLKHHYNDFLAWILIGICSVFCFFCLFPWPAWIAKITLLYEVLERRMIVAMDFIQLVLIFRLLATSTILLRFRMMLLCTIAYLLFIVWCWDFELYQEYNSLFLFVVLVTSYLVIISMLRYRSILVAVICWICFFSGMTINPIAYGVSSIYETELGKNISDIASQDKGNWIVEASEDVWNYDGIWIMNNYPIMFGAPTINSFQYYVYWPRWNTFQLSDDDRKVLNRSGHMNVILTKNEKTSFQCLRQYASTADVVTIMLNINDLSKLETSYILTMRNLEYMNNEKIVFVELVSCNGYKIYQIRYV